MIAGITEKEQKIIEHILDKYRKDYAFFYYGSRVKGTYEKTSDLDVLIKGKAEMPLAILQEIKEEFDKSDLPYIVNFSDYYKLDSSFYERIKPDLIPYNWQEVKLGNFLIINPTEKLSKGTIAKKVSMEKLQPFSRDVSGYELDEFSGGAKFRNKDTIMARITPCLENGKRAQINILKQGDVGFGSTEFIVFREKGNISDANFIYYLVCSDLIRSPAIKSMVGSSGRQRVQTNVLENLHLSLPPLTIQKKIAGVLGALDDKIELNNKINQNLEAQVQALFKSWFVDFEPFGGKMPDDWKIGKFSDIITDTLGGDWGKETPQNNYTEEVSCIRGADIPDVKLGNKGKIPTRFILPKNYTNKKLIPGDLVIEISGGSPTQSTGRIAFISNHLLNRYNRKIICTNFCRAIKPMFGYSEYIYQYWQYLYDKDIFFTYENGTTGIKNLDLSGVLNTESIIIPNKSALMVFSEICNSYFDNIHFNGLEIEHLAELRDSLLPKLMSGEINVDNVKID